MRESGLRAWDKIHKHMLKVRGITFWDEGGIKEVTVPMIMCPECSRTFSKVDDFIFMHNTGLKDRHGNAIYEGDVIICFAENYNYTGIVAYDQDYDTGSYCLHTKKSNNEIVDLIMARFAGCSKVVIGNIFEHPILLKKIISMEWTKEHLNDLYHQLGFI